MKTKVNGLIRRWISNFGKNVDKEILEEHVVSYGNYLWHLFTWGNVPCLEGDEARITFDNLQYTEAIKFSSEYSNCIEKRSFIGKVSAEEIDNSPERDVYIVAKDFSWTYVRTHEEDFGPYFCKRSEKYEN